MRKKIFYLTDLLSPYRVDWINELSKYFDVECFAFDKEEKTRRTEWLNSQSPMFRITHLKSKTLFGIRFSSECLALLKKDEFDIYLIDGYSSFAQVKVIKKLAKQKKNVFVNVDGIDVWKKNNLLYKIKKLIKKSIYTSGAKFLCGSKIASNFIVSNGAKQKDVFIHPFTSLHKSDLISFEQKQKNQLFYKEKIGASNNKVAIAVGRFIPLKRFGDIIYAWKGMPKDWKLYVIGGGELLNSYKKIILDNNLSNVTLLDFLNPNELKNYFYAADLLVHPSETETWGLIINEAMSKCCPCICTNRCVAGMELIINNKNGYVIKVGDIQNLSNKVRTILSDDILRGSMMKMAEKTIQDYTIENLARIHADIFGEFLI